MRSRYPIIASLLAAGLIAGCGGSSNADTANIQLPTSQSQTLTYSATSTTTTSTSTTPTITTPTSGPLSKEPTITVPTTPAPTNLVTTDLIEGTGATAQGRRHGDRQLRRGALQGRQGLRSSWSRTRPSAPRCCPAGGDPRLGQRHTGHARRRPPRAHRPAGTRVRILSQASIPANSTLIFVVDLLGVTPASGG